MVGLPCLVSQCANLHVGGWTWAVFTRVYLEFHDFYSVSPEKFGSTHVNVFVPNDLFHWMEIFKVIPVNKCEYIISSLFLRVFANLRKATISFVMSVSPSVRPPPMEQLGSHRTDFHEIWYLNTFRKYVEKIQVSLTPDTNKRVLYMKTNINFWYLAQFLFEWELFHTQLVQKIKSHIRRSFVK
jgi:hypothetical protein